jgi:hypothetical protein
VNRRIVLVVALIAILLASGVVIVFRHRSADPPYANLRQATEEEVPGTFGLLLKPPPPGFDPAISPVRAQEIASQGRKAPGPVFFVLASVSGFYTGASTETPQWLVIVRNLCYPGEKGELVSGSRHLGQTRNCSMSNLWIQLVDPTTGDRTSVLRGYDPTATWLPDTGAAA